jgi:hypothetical protein
VRNGDQTQKLVGATTFDLRDTFAVAEPVDARLVDRD